MASVPMGEIGGWVADRLGGSTTRAVRVPVDSHTFVVEMQGQAASAIESRLRPLMGDRPKGLRRDQHSAGSLYGKNGPAVYNVRWNGWRGLSPGFTVIMRNNKKQVGQLRITGRVTTPWAIALGLLIGVLLEGIWYPLFAPSFLHWGSALLGLYIVAILVSTAFIYYILVKITNILFISIVILGLCGAAAVGLSFLWGFVGGFLLGWVVVTRATASGSGAALRQQLAQAIDASVETLAVMAPARAYAPVPYWPGAPTGTSYRVPAQPAGPVGVVNVPGFAQPVGVYAQPLGVYAQPQRPPTPVLARPAPPPIKEARVAPSAARPVMQAAPSTYPCPTCGTPLPDGAARCNACKTDIVWG